VAPGAKDNRKAKRRDVTYRAWLRYGENSVLVPCTMQDVSQTGARLVIAGNAGIPDEFVLQLTENGPAHRRCRIAWRTEKKIGVAFSAV